MKTVHIVGGDYMIERMFALRGYTSVEDADGADLLCFTGGADVSPILYGDAKHATTHYNIDRDMREKAVFDNYKDVPKVGICRGSQFLNVMSGGKLWQDVSNHAIGHTHDMFYLSDRKYDFVKVYKGHNEDGNWSYAREVGKADHIDVTSTHHQMMMVNKDEAEVWGVAFLSHHRDRGRDEHKRSDYAWSPDIEIANYPKTKSLCFQPHPEYGVKSCEDLFFKCLDRAFG